MKNHAQVASSISRPSWLTVGLHLLAALLLVLTPLLLARGQKPEEISILDVTTRLVSNTTLVTITANGPLSHAQMRQDSDGYHIVVPGAQVAESVKDGRGYKVRTLRDGVEILLNSRPGTPVQVNTDNNHINLSVTGDLSSDSSGSNSGQPNSSYSLPDYGVSSNTAAPSSSPSDVTAKSDQPLQNVNHSVPAPAQIEGQVPSLISVGEAQGGTVFTHIFSWPGFVIVAVMSAIALFFVHNSRPKVGRVDDRNEVEDSDRDESGDGKVRNSKSQDTVVPARNGRVVPTGGTTHENKLDIRPAQPPPVSLYSAYRIGQEVRKLVMGQPHRNDVLSSRGMEDRRAIQASLIKILAASESSEAEQTLARSALEAYGYVARESATLLASPDPFDRTAAARTLGETGSPAALPALLEALHDPESIVRNQVVSSIGELKDASAIGALIELARHHREVPFDLISGALRSCSFEAVDLLDEGIKGSSTTTDHDNGIFDFAQLEPTSAIEELPEMIEDATLVEALAMARSESAQVRSDAVKTLAQYPVKTAIAVLVSLAKHDSESMVRALAVSSLGFIDHELVFPAVLIGLADESRDVRAAAARALSRLSFDRSAAYATLVQTADDQTLRDVAQACIKAGIVSQNIDRLANRDRRQAYEAFCLISLLAKAGMTTPVLEAIEVHRNLTVRLSAIHLLASTGEESVFEQLQELAGNDELDEELKTAALSEMYTIQQAQRRQRKQSEQGRVSRAEESEPGEYSPTEGGVGEFKM